MSCSGYGGIGGADRQIYIRLTRLCINWLWFCRKHKQITFNATPAPTETHSERHKRSFFFLYRKDNCPVIINLRAKVKPSTLRSQIW